MSKIPLAVLEKSGSETGVASSCEQDEVLSAIASRYGLPRVGSFSEAEWVLHRHEGLLALARGDDVRTRIQAPVSVTALNPGNPLLRAMGGAARRVLDATGGWAEDARRLIIAGHRVTAVERHPLVYEMVKEALEAAEDDWPELRWKLAESGQGEMLADGGGARFDVVYLDPMFPAKRRQSAASRKHLALLKHLAVSPDEEESRALLDWARRQAGLRVVVKRAVKSPCLGSVPPSGSIAGSLVRYDLYAPVPSGDE